MDNQDLFNVLMQRQTAPTKVPQKTKRWENANQIQEAYANDWNPNPLLLRALLGHT